MHPTKVLFLLAATLAVALAQDEFVSPDVETETTVIPSKVQYPYLPYEHFYPYSPDYQSFVHKFPWYFNTHFYKHQFPWYFHGQTFNHQFPWYFNSPIYGKEVPWYFHYKGINQIYPWYNVNKGFNQVVPWKTEFGQHVPYPFNYVHYKHVPKYYGNYPVVNDYIQGRNIAQPDSVINPTTTQPSLNPYLASLLAGRDQSIGYGYNQQVPYYYGTYDQEVPYYYGQQYPYNTLNQELPNSFGVSSQEVPYYPVSDYSHGIHSELAAPQISSLPVTAPSMPEIGLMSPQPYTAPMKTQPLLKTLLRTPFPYKAKKNIALENAVREMAAEQLVRQILSQ